MKKLNEIITKLKKQYIGYKGAVLNWRPFKNLCQSGKITNTQGNTDECKNRCRAICS